MVVWWEMYGVGLVVCSVALEMSGWGVWFGRVWDIGIHRNDCVGIWRLGACLKRYGRVYESKSTSLASQMIVALCALEMKNNQPEPVRDVFLLHKSCILKELSLVQCSDIAMCPDQIAWFWQQATGINMAETNGMGSMVSRERISDQWKSVHFDCEVLSQLFWNSPIISSWMNVIYVVECLMETVLPQDESVNVPRLDALATHKDSFQVSSSSWGTRFRAT